MKFLINNNSDDNINFNYKLAPSETLHIEIIYNSLINIINSDIYLSNISKFNVIEKKRIFIKYMKQKNLKNLAKNNNINAYHHSI